MHFWNALRRRGARALARQRGDTNIIGTCRLRVCAGTSFWGRHLTRQRARNLEASQTGPTEPHQTLAHGAERAGEASLERSFHDVQALAECAALGLGLPFAQAARFGAAAALHLGEGRPADALTSLLEKPAQISALSLQVERAVEAASTSASAFRLSEGPHIVAASFAHSLPCDVRVERVADGLDVRVLLNAPQKRARPNRVAVPVALWSRMEEIAGRPDTAGGSITVPLKAAGACLMELD